MKRTHIDLFVDNSWDWTLSNATISGGILDITSAPGSGKRYPDINWFSGTNDDFIIEIDFKQDSTPGATTLLIYLALIGEPDWLYFWIDGSANNMEIRWDGVIRATQAFVDDVAWHTAKIRRVGTIYYFSIDGGAEISWDYGIARAINHLTPSMFECTGEFDNFKYYPIEIGVSTGVGNPMIL